MSTRIALYTEDMGAYLGNCLGFGFWSKLDHLDLNEAVTFPSEEVAEEEMAMWDSGRPAAPQFISVEVADEKGYATIEELVRAGIPGWMPKEVTFCHRMNQ